MHVTNVGKLLPVNVIVKEMTLVSKPIYVTSVGKLTESMVIVKNM